MIRDLVKEADGLAEGDGGLTVLGFFQEELGVLLHVADGLQDVLAQGSHCAFVVFFSFPRLDMELCERGAKRERRREEESGR